MNDYIEGLNYSNEGLSNRVLFLSDFNNINIYVEDIGKEYEYEDIFERLFNNEINLFSVFPLGGKDAVIKAFYEKGIIDSEKKTNIYIVDGDFDNIWDDCKVNSPNVIYLSRYNIESYYCSKEAVIKFVRMYLRIRREEANNLVKFDNWRHNFCSTMVPLFILFALVKKHSPTTPNVGVAIKSFLDDNGDLIVESMSKYRSETSNKIESIDSIETEIKEKIDKNFIGDTEEKNLSIICGKFQIESLCRYLKCQCGRNISRDYLRNYLIENFDLSTLDFLKNKILFLQSQKNLSYNTA